MTIEELLKNYETDIVMNERRLWYSEEFSVYIPKHWDQRFGQNFEAALDYFLYGDENEEDRETNG